MSDKKIFGSIMLLTTGFIWGLSYSFQNMSADILGPFTVSFTKFIGGIFLIPMVLKSRIRIDKKLMEGGIVLAIITMLGTVFQQIGIENTTVSKASFLTSLYIVFVPLLQIVTGKKPEKRIYIAIAIATTGVYFLCMEGSFSLNKGDILTLIGTFFWAVQIIAIDRYIDKCDPITLTMIQQIISAVLSFVPMILFEKPVLNDFKTAIIPTLYAIFMSGCLAQYLQNRYQKDVEPSLASLLMSFESVFGAIGGWIMLNQAMHLKEIFGCVLIFIAILIAE